MFGEVGVGALGGGDFFDLFGFVFFGVCDGLGCGGSGGRCGWGGSVVGGGVGFVFLRGGFDALASNFLEVVSNIFDIFIGNIERGEVIDDSAGEDGEVLEGGLSDVDGALFFIFFDEDGFE